MPGMLIQLHTCSGRGVGATSKKLPLASPSLPSSTTSAQEPPSALIAQTSWRAGGARSSTTQHTPHGVLLQATNISIYQPENRQQDPHVVHVMPVLTSPAELRHSAPSRCSGLWKSCHSMLHGACRHTAPYTLPSLESWQKELAAPSSELRGSSMSSGIRMSRQLLPASRQTGVGIHLGLQLRLWGRWWGWGGFPGG